MSFKSRLNSSQRATGDNLSGHFVRQIRNFMNNWQVVGGNMHFDGYRVRLTVDPGKGGGAATPPHPWKVTRNDDSETETKRVRVHPGSIGGVVPTNVLAAANDGLTISGSGLEYVVLNCVAESATIQSCSLSIESSQPPSPSATESFPPEAFQDLIALIYDGIIYQIRNRNITATSVLALTADTEEAEPFRENVIRFYTWILGG